MSWLDNVKNSLIIRTGDGLTYTPNWLNAVKKKEYNVSEFEFIDISGTLVDRKKVKGSRYTLEIYFQGDDHLDTAEAFDVSTDDSRAWELTHPIYPSLLIVQPLSITRDNSQMNVSKFVCEMVETITDENPKFTSDPIDKITFDKSVLDDVSANSFATEIPAPDTSAINGLKFNVKSVYDQGVKSVKTNIDSETYFNLYNTANSSIINATSKPLEAIRGAMAVINAPFQFADGVKNRVKILVTQFNILKDTILNLTAPKRSDKKIYENNSTVSVGAMAVGVVTNPDYITREDVFNTVEVLSNTYNAHLATLDEIQSDNGGSPDSYVADYASLAALSELISFTISNLFIIAISAKQERAFFLEEDSNWIILAHRLYGLQPDDSTIQNLMDINNAGLNEVLQIKKGRKIIYYV